jgi:hypothetical protein
VSLTNDLRDYARELRLDFIGSCLTDALGSGPEGTKPTRYLENAKSVISIGYRLNYAPLQNLPASRGAYMLEHDYANWHLVSSQMIMLPKQGRSFKR